MKQAFLNTEHFKQSASFRGDKAEQKYPKILTAWLNKLCHFHYRPKEVLGPCPRHKQSSTNILTPCVGTRSEAIQAPSCCPQPSAGHPHLCPGWLCTTRVFLWCPGPEGMSQTWGKGPPVTSQKLLSRHLPLLWSRLSHLYHCRYAGHWILKAKCLLGGHRIME